VSAKDAKDRQAAHDASKSASTVAATLASSAVGAISGLADKFSKMDSKPYEMPPLVSPNPPKSITEIAKVPPQLDRDYVKGAGVICIVDQPQVTPGSKVVTFRISSKSNMTEYSKKSSLQVRRTFVEFQQFYRHLIRLYPYFIIPPLVDRKRMLQSTPIPSIEMMKLTIVHCRGDRFGFYGYQSKALPEVSK